MLELFKRKFSVKQGFEMFVKMFTVGMFGTNCFLVGDTESHEAAIIDPGFDRESEAKIILSEIKRNDFKVKYIINTHGHPDHTSGNKMLKDVTGAPILIHEFDYPLLSNPPADQKLHDGDLIEIGNIKFRVIRTPGHSKGSIILLGADAVFSGDILFAGSIGRFDLPGGSLEETVNSLKNKILILPDHLRVYPGHGPVTTIGEERRSNPFLQNFDWTLYE
jgi:glyoxylase-like metal-dependent hydrolase (beta-lactamase superfamily II)